MNEPSSKYILKFRRREYSRNGPDGAYQVLHGRCADLLDRVKVY